MPVTRNDVARAAGVSPGVVSYVLNSGPRPVSDEARKRVLDAVDALGYKRDGLARSLKTGRTDTLGVILPDASNPFFAELARSIEDSAYRIGKCVLVCNSADEIDRERVYLNALVERRVDGIILVSTSGEEDLSGVLGVGIPLVTMDRHRELEGVSTVRFDNRHAGRAATRHALEHGHTDVLMIGGPGDISLAAERVAGYQDAIEDAGLTPRLTAGTPFTFGGGYAAASNSVTRPAVSAIVCSSDAQAIGASAALRDAGLRIPEDVAIISIDGTMLTAYTEPPLTSVRQPIEEMAELAVQAVLAKDEASHRRLVGELVLRRSCGCHEDLNLFMGKRPADGKGCR